MKTPDSRFASASYPPRRRAPRGTPQVLGLGMVLLWSAGLFDSPPIALGQADRTLVVGQTGDANEYYRERLIRRFNADRQQAMVSDAERLWMLATEVNANVQRHGALSPPEIGKIAEIEKLARKVREKMLLAPETR